MIEPTDVLDIGIIGENMGRRPRKSDRDDGETQAEAE